MLRRVSRIDRRSIARPLSFLLLPVGFLLAAPLEGENGSLELLGAPDLQGLPHELMQAIELSHQITSSTSRVISRVPQCDRARFGLARGVVQLSPWVSLAARRTVPVVWGLKSERSCPPFTRATRREPEPEPSPREGACADAVDQACILERPRTQDQKG